MRVETWLGKSELESLEVALDVPDCSKSRRSGGSTYRQVPVWFRPVRRKRPGNALIC